ncbi:LPXTG cell wall anchor domain-containing protein [Glycomyces paridis]|uniref:LPXTG cell wall anchor domain-containing protein n=1 Tax=Glycomyces paridis TaxID=2126555 RepID=A0A4S8PCJ5_9ACTN|nr:LPXTG cell wall anchor domain-containing protein [Glycomyces paridis]THV28043.1 LPXTG cell wall anchor domain-containing protein [Glycomyces paridis]
MERNRSLTSRGALGLAAAAGLTGVLAFGSPAHAAVAVIPINGGNVPTTAEDFKDNSCDNLPGDLAADVDGWVFVLPAAAGAEGNFISVTATFEDGDGGEHVLTTDADGGIVSGSGDNKAYIITPAGWTLTDAEAEVEDPAEGAKFNLTHACPGSPGENPSSPEESPSAPGSESPSAPGSESPSAPGEESTTPVGSTLPTTGTPLTITLVSAAALAAAGAVLFLMRRRRAAQDW